MSNAKARPHETAGVLASTSILPAGGGITIRARSDVKVNIIAGAGDSGRCPSLCRMTGAAFL